MIHFFQIFSSGTSKLSQALGCPRYPPIPVISIQVAQSAITKTCLRLSARFVFGGMEV